MAEGLDRLCGFIFKGQDKRDEPWHLPTAKKKKENILDNVVFSAFNAVYF
jgi:hypothetical protein